MDFPPQNEILVIRRHQAARFAYTMYTCCSLGQSKDHILKEFCLTEFFTNFVGYNDLYPQISD